MTSADRSDAEDRVDNHIDRYAILTRLQIFAAIGCFLIFLYALHFWPYHDVLRIIGIGVLAAAAALTFGFLLGFIFGIPRMGSEKQATHTSTNADGAQDESDAAPPNPVTANSNLVEISDWLTKIIVGVGLVELNTIPVKLGELSRFIGTGLRPTQCNPPGSCADFIESAQAAAFVILVFYFALGFLFGYIWTRLYFQRDLGNLLENLQRYKKVTDSILKAEAFINEGKLDEALESINYAIKKNPRDGRAILTKGRILKRKAMEPGIQDADKKKLLNQALDCANQAIALLPGKAEPIYNKACYQALLGFDRVEVLSSLRSAFKLNPGLRRTAADDSDLMSLQQDADFRQFVNENQSANS